MIDPQYYYEERISLLSGILDSLLRLQPEDFVQSEQLQPLRATYPLYDSRRHESIWVSNHRQSKEKRTYRNHSQGNRDNRDVKKRLALHLSERSENDFSQFIQARCHYISIANTDEYQSLGHFAIAILRPLLNDASGSFAAPTSVGDSLADYQEELLRLCSSMYSLMLSESYRLVDVISGKSHDQNAALHAVPGVYVISNEHNVVACGAAGSRNTSTRANDAKRAIYYVGQSFSIRARLSANIQADFEKWLGSDNFDPDRSSVKYLSLQDARESIYLEHFLIAVLNPTLNR